MTTETANTMADVASDHNQLADTPAKSAAKSVAAMQVASPASVVQTEAATVLACAAKPKESVKRQPEHSETEKRIAEKEGVVCNKPDQQETVAEGATPEVEQVAEAPPVEDASPKGSEKSKSDDAEPESAPANNVNEATEAAQTEATSTDERNIVGESEVINGQDAADTIQIATPCKSAPDALEAGDNSCDASPMEADSTVPPIKNFTTVVSTLPPTTPQRGHLPMYGYHDTPMRSPRGTPRSPSTPTSPNVELSPKQVRELRRLCRKTANRAEYEGRLVQLRQIASILAMGGPSLIHFAPSYLSAHSAMQAWLDACRSGGADWRDERPLSVAAVEELREWDRLLKAWAKRRFPTLADCAEGCAPPTTPRTKRLDLISLASPMSASSPSPARALINAQSTAVASPSSLTPGSRRRVSRMSISHDGDTINVSIVRSPDVPIDAENKTPWRGAASPRRDQENVSPEGDGPRDWRNLRKGAYEAQGSTALKARNW